MIYKSFEICIFSNAPLTFWIMFLFVLTQNKHYKKQDDIIVRESNSSLQYHIIRSIIDIVNDNIIPN